MPRAETLPRRRPPDTAHERKDLSHAGTLSSAKASRHSARAKGFARARTLPSAKASRHGARAKEFAPRGSRSPHVPTNGGPHPTDGQPEKHPFGGVAPETAHERRDLPRGVRVRPTCRRTAGRPLPVPRQKNTPSAGSHPRRRGRCRVHSPKKIRLLHEIQLFYGESHVGSRPIFPSFPSVGRCVARERTPVPPVAPHCGRGHRSLRRTGEMHHGFGEMVRRFDE